MENVSKLLNDLKYKEYTMEKMALQQRALPVPTPAEMEEVERRRAAEIERQKKIGILDLAERLLIQQGDISALCNHEDDIGMYVDVAADFAKIAEKFLNTPEVKDDDN